MRIAVVDIGTNSTRLLVADVGRARSGGPAFAELARRSTVTRLGQGVDRTGRLDPGAMERVERVLDGYRAEADALGAEATTGVMTSAVREAANGAEFVRRVRGRHGFAVRAIPGEEEARLTYRGAIDGRAGDDGRVVVIDVGGGSTEVVVGSGERVAFHVSTPAGVVRLSERHLRGDPPSAAELSALEADVSSILDATLPADVRDAAGQAIGVAGTATSLASIDQALEPYDPARVDGYEVTLAACERILGRLARMTEERRRAVPGLHPDRAPTILAGAVILPAVVRAFGLDRFEASESDILRGEALRYAAASS
ncbi:MAG: Ppx/GppA phosphatase family protein [Solirubrobacteraceae bacterium]